MGAVQGYQPMDSFGTDAAEIYDAQARGDEVSTVALLAELARGGPALELAIGTGRIALPLSARRWGGWERQPFTSTCRNHVSVYGR